jgi:antitoxin component YwqK of YwqJK toxin-antitoxin module
MKLMFTITILLLASTCFAQKQNVYYLKNDGSYVSTKDQADYIRIVREPDAGSELYNVLEFYKNGQQQLIGKSSKVFPVVFEGQVARFYPNGKKMQVANYHNNHVMGLFYDYFPSGKIFSVREYSVSTNETIDDYRIISCLDTAGNLLVNEGNGHYFGYFGGKGIMEEGEVKGGFRDGDWKGSLDRG